MAACRNGHPLTPTNVYRRPADASVRCQQCRREAVARYKARRRGRPDPTADFERQLLRLAANGATDQEIADRIGVSLGKVTWAWRRLKRELGGRDRTHTVVLAIRSRRISLADVPDRRVQQARERATGPLSRPNGAPVDSGPSGVENASEAHSPASRPTNQTKAA